MKKQAVAYSKRIKEYHRRYTEILKHFRRHRYSKKEQIHKRSNKDQSQLIRYTRLYKNDRLALKRRYRQYKIYDHLSRMDLDNWKRLGIKANRLVYTDLIGTKYGHHYYRIRMSPSQKHMYWVRANALKFVKPVYYYHPYQIDTHEINSSHAYNQILGTDNLVRSMPSQLHKRAYRSNLFAIAPSNYSGRVWYRIKNDRGRLVWLAGNSKHATQYLKYNEPKYLSSYHTSAPLMNHASDSDYHDHNYSWSRVKPKRDRVKIDRLAIDTKNNDSFWYRINNHHHLEWTNVSAFR